MTVDPDAYETTSDPRRVILHITGGIGDEVERIDVIERPTSVSFEVTLRRMTGIVNPAIGVRLTAEVTLGEPIGQRPVLDAFGRPVPRR